jgi:elongation factor Ts
MTQISAAQVKTLRDRTGAGMMDCKKALEEAEGNEEKAVEIIQKKGLAKVAKKAGAIAADGLIHAYIHAGSRVGVMVEVNCQTDFVARNEEFKQFVSEVAMHIAAEKPEFVRAEEISEAAIAKQTEIFFGQLDEEAKQTGKEKPRAALEKIVEGKLAKWKKDVVLLDQEFIMSEDKKTVGVILDELSAKIGEKLSIRRFVRYELGEGIEKKVADLAADVAATIAGTN